MKIPGLDETIRTFGRIGFLSFGGPAAQIALMHNVLVDEKKWLNEQQFLNALSFCMLLPGPEAMQLATYSGWRLHGVIGGLIAGLLFVLPGAVVMLSLATIYAYFGDVELVDALFLGVKATVLIIVIEALLKVSRRALKLRAHWVLAALAFVGIFFFAAPFPIIIFCAAIYGFFFTGHAQEAENIDDIKAVNVSILDTFKTIFIWLSIWVFPVIIIGYYLDCELFNLIASFFSKLAVVTFGGAYAVLAYMAQDVVTQFGWLTAGEMMDGLGLAETTPGPLILVTEFVGFLAAFREGGFWFGVVGAVLTLWVTFVPCFLWIFAGAPYIEQISAQPKLKGALSAITAAVVGVILNLSIWFGLHVLFSNVTQKSTGILTLWQPELLSIDWRVLILLIVSAVLLFRFKIGLMKMLGISAGLGWFMASFLT
ncbi:chromate efflux transporter [Lentilitoribacter sp. EG35]|uniref:chromate efflux transporter n=1 Tax=Lentilitoribacter sp. EG35 TaxID=3234192 RepID=UPI0034605C2D